MGRIGKRWFTLSPLRRFTLSPPRRFASSPFTQLTRSDISNPLRVKPAMVLSPALKKPETLTPSIKGASGIPWFTV
ncbi:MAG TPA: hypothetical protein VIX17_01325, partial [Pyrinomonadaceae bacterium]